jgi:hypothetical protein
MKFPTPPAGTTEAQIEAGIDEALAEAVRAGSLVATGQNAVVGTQAMFDSDLYERAVRSEEKLRSRSTTP